jgi:hypothetical protein
MLNASEMGKKGIKVVNAMLTKDMRSANAKKGWALRKAKLSRGKK